MPILPKPVRRKPFCSACGDVGVGLSKAFVLRRLGRRRRSEWGTQAIFDEKPALVICTSCYAIRARRTRVPRCRPGAPSEVVDRRGCPA